MHLFILSLLMYIHRFFFDSIAWNLLSRIAYSASVSLSVSVIPSPDPGSRVLNNKNGSDGKMFAVRTFLT